MYQGSHFFTVHSCCVFHLLFILTSRYSHIIYTYELFSLQLIFSVYSICYLFWQAVIPLLFILTSCFYYSVSVAVRGGVRARQLRGQRLHLRPGVDGREMWSALLWLTLCQPRTVSQRHMCLHTGLERSSLHHTWVTVSQLHMCLHTVLKRPSLYHTLVTVSQRHMSAYKAKTAVTVSYVSYSVTQRHMGLHTWLVVYEIHYISPL